MEGMRELLRKSLARSLEGMQEEDRVAAAWPVACGKAMAGHGLIARYADGMVWVEVEDEAWLRQMMSMRRQLTAELGRIAGVPVREIHFEVKRSEATRNNRQ
jgi:trehalose-6-phosphatase